MAIIGIDLGTTNSLVSVWKEGEIHLIPNSLGQYLTPSIVNITKDGSLIVGQTAKDRLISQPQNTVSLFKRDMGSQKIFTLGNKRFLPEELSSFILRSLKEDAENFLNEEVTEAVISVPAYFNDTQRKATKNAGILAGLIVERLINEPTAAALAYGLHDRINDGIFLILDLGGGTFDVSLLEFTDGIMEVHAVAGDNRLGGEDFTEVIQELFLDHHNISKESLSSIERENLYNQAEKCKTSLSDSRRSVITFDKAGTKLEMTINMEDFAQASQPLLERLRKPIERTLRDAKIDLDSIDDLVLVGGATRMPIFRDVVHRMFKRLPMINLNPDEIVGRGVGIQAGLKSRDEALEEIILTDICPYTLGTSVVEGMGEKLRGGLFLPIINRNTTVPVSKVVCLGTAKDNQNKLKIDIYQGEHRLVKDNIKLGSLDISIPPAPAGHIAVNLRYTYDINGLLEVEVDIPQTGLHKSLIIEENPGVLTKEEINKRLEKLQTIKMHPREQADNIALIARGERLWEEYIGDTRTQITNILNRFEYLLEQQEIESIENYKREMINYFDYIER